jgi:hypothetical protein
VVDGEAAERHALCGDRAREKKSRASAHWQSSQYETAGPVALLPDSG